MIARKAVKAKKDAAGPPRRVRAEEIIIEEVATPAATVGARDATVGSRIQQARLNADVTQLGLSKIAGLGRSAIAQWERGDSYPNIQTASISLHIAEAPLAPLPSDNHT